jgi:hypothetical protein
MNALIETVIGIYFEGFLYLKMSAYLLIKNEIDYLKVAY